MMSFITRLPSVVNRRRLALRSNAAHEVQLLLSCVNHCRQPAGCRGTTPTTGNRTSLTGGASIGHQASVSWSSTDEEANRYGISAGPMTKPIAGSKT